MLEFGFFDWLVFLCWIRTLNCIGGVLPRVGSLLMSPYHLPTPFGTIISKKLIELKAHLIYHFILAFSFRWVLIMINALKLEYWNMNIIILNFWMFVANLFIISQSVVVQLFNGYNWIAEENVAKFGIFHGWQNLYKHKSAIESKLYSNLWWKCNTTAAQYYSHAIYHRWFNEYLCGLSCNYFNVHWWLTTTNSGACSIYWLYNKTRNHLEFD